MCLFGRKPKKDETSVAPREVAQNSTVGAERPSSSRSRPPTRPGRSSTVGTSSRRPQRRSTVKKSASTRAGPRPAEDATVRSAASTLTGYLQQHVDNYFTDPQKVAASQQITDFLVTYVDGRRKALIKGATPPLKDKSFGDLNKALAKKFSNTGRTAAASSNQTSHLRSLFDQADRLADHLSTRPEYAFIRPPKRQGSKILPELQKRGSRRK